MNGLNFEFEQIELQQVDLREFNDFTNKPIFTTIAWIRFIEVDSNAKPIIVRITRKGNYIGYFTALLVKKFGISIVASPFSGWSTCYMGFDLIGNEIKSDIIGALSEYLFSKFKCAYIEIIDRDISVEQAKTTGLDFIQISTLELDINKTDEDLFKVFKTDCRNFIRQFEKRGATLEEAKADDNFANEYYLQLKDVFAKQGMVPTYSEEKIKNLLRQLSTSSMLLCLRVKNPEGLSIATSIFIGHQKKFFFWGGASLRHYQSYRPNEYMIWYAIKYWRERGCETFDMVGVRDYKRKFGPVEKEYVRIVITKFKILLILRNIAQQLYFVMLRIRGKLQRVE